MSKPLKDLVDSGLLWLINRVVFHPRGYALFLEYSPEDVIGWGIMGNGTEPYVFSEEQDDLKFAAVNKLLEEVKQLNA